MIIVTISEKPHVSLGNLGLKIGYIDRSHTCCCFFSFSALIASCQGQPLSSPSREDLLFQESSSASRVFSVILGSNQGLCFRLVPVLYAAHCGMLVLHGHKNATALLESLKCQIWWQVEVNADVTFLC